MVVSCKGYDAKRWEWRRNIQHAYKGHEIMPEMNNEFGLKECHPKLL